MRLAPPLGEPTARRGGDGVAGAAVVRSVVEQGEAGAGRVFEIDDV